MVPAMQIYLVRHAIAEARGGAWEDAERPLTLEGIERVERTVRGLARLRVEFDHVYTSPWRRALETAQRLAPLMPTGDRRQTELLAQAPTPALLRQLHGERIALVGHEPWLGELLALLVVGDPTLGNRFPFKKAGVAWLEGSAEPGGCDLKAHWTPRSLRMAAQS